MASTFDLTFEFAPYRLSGTVYGVLMNHRAALAALGEAAHQPPYKAPPKAPVLYVKPRNTLVAPGAPLRIDDPAGELEVGAALGVVIGRTACAVAESEALDFVAGYVIVADCSLPHDSYFRPADPLQGARRLLRHRAEGHGPRRHRRSRCARRPRPGGRPAGARHQHRRHVSRRGSPGERHQRVHDPGARRPAAGGRRARLAAGRRRRVAGDRDRRPRPARDPGRPRRGAAGDEARPRRLCRGAARGDPGRGAGHAAPGRRPDGGRGGGRLAGAVRGRHDRRARPQLRRPCQGAGLQRPGRAAGVPQGTGLGHRPSRQRRAARPTPPSCTTNASSRW